MDKQAVAIIGGGLAGLTAADALASCEELKITVFEARGILGGRVLSKKTAANTTVEVGANWIHELPNKKHAYHPIKQLLNQATPSRKYPNTHFIPDSTALIKAKIHTMKGESRGLFNSIEGAGSYLIQSIFQTALEDLYDKENALLLNFLEDRLAELVTYADLLKAVKEFAVTKEALCWFDKTQGFDLKVLSWSKIIPFLEHSEWFSYSLFRSLIQEAQEEIKLGNDAFINPIMNNMEIFYGDGAKLKDLPYSETSELDGNSDHFVNGGMDRAIKELSKNVVAELNAKVLEIKHDIDGRSTLIYSQDGELKTWKGDCVIVTIPLGVLKKSPEEGGVAFSPPLSLAKEKAIDKLGMKNHRKLIYTFNIDDFIAAKIKAPIIYINEQEEEHLILNVDAFEGPYAPINPTLIVWFSGAKADHADQEYSEGSNNLKINVLNVITKHYSTLNLDSLIDYTDKAWGQDPLSEGSYSFVPVGAGPDEQNAFLSPEHDGHLFFAGEHTYAGGEATMHAAYYSGKRVADQVEKFLGN